MNSVVFYCCLTRSLKDEPEVLQQKPEIEEPELPMPGSWNPPMIPLHIHPFMRGGRGRIFAPRIGLAGGMGRGGIEDGRGLPPPSQDNT